MNETVRQHFRRADPILSRLIDEAGGLSPGISKNYLRSICREIIGQQLAGKAADAIFLRFLLLFPRKIVSAKLLHHIADQKLRDVGMAWSKVRSLKDVAQKVIEGELVLKNIHNLHNEDVIKELTKVKGIGPWTAEMFLMFSLGRPDIFSHGDLGLRRAIQKVYGFTREPTKRQVEKLEKRWRPYRTYACLALWQSLEKK